MGGDKTGLSPLIAACRGFAAQLLSDVSTAARQVLVGLIAVIAGGLLLLGAAAVCTVIGIALAARGLHSLCFLVLRSTWQADLVTGLILVAVPWVVLVLARRLAGPAVAATPARAPDEAAGSADAGDSRMPAPTIHRDSPLEQHQQHE